MTALDDLYAEDIPHRPNPAPPQPRAWRPTWTPEEQDQHWADLNAALADWRWQDDTRVGKRRQHLQLIRTARAA